MRLPVRGSEVTPRLAAREIAALYLVATGHSLDAAGAALHLSPETVKFYLRTASIELGTRERAHTVAEAFRLGYLATDPVTREIVANPYARPVRSLTSRQQTIERIRGDQR